MRKTVNTQWLGDMKFDSFVDGHHILVDVPSESGENTAGPKPKTLLLTALAGCTGMDVVSLLKKMKVDIDSFTIEVTADETEEHPKHYSRMHIIYRFTGKDLPIDKIEKVIGLSQERYCGVSFMFRKAMEITHEIIIQE